MKQVLIMLFWTELLISLRDLTRHEQLQLLLTEKVA